MVENNLNDILTIDQAAELLKVSSKTIYDLVSDERIPGKIFAKKVGRSWRIMRKEIDSYLSEEPAAFQQMSIKNSESTNEKN